MSSSEFYLAEFIAIGFQTESDSLSFGQGFNCEVEAGFASHPGFDEGEARGKLRATLAQIDHKIIGRDIQIAATPEALCRWILENLPASDQVRPVGINLKLGNDLRCSLRRI